MITQQKKEDLIQKMEALNIKEADLEESFTKGSGSGGQKLNKTANTVLLKHLPTGIIIKCQKTRSREDNRFFARRLLCEELDFRQNGTQSARELAIQKIRKQKQKRAKRAQA